MSKPLLLDKNNLPQRYTPISKRFKNIENEKFGLLTALYPCGKDTSNHIEWVCQCSCEEHNYIKVAQNKLNSGNTGSCGCQIGLKNKIKAKEIQEERIGKIYNNLKVIALGDYAIKPDGRKDRMLLCECLICGNKKQIRASDVITGRTKACGCTNSIGNFSIKEYLNNNNINFLDEYIIEECKDKRPLPFDFAFFKDNQLIGLLEYQGIQHFTCENHGWDDKEKFKIVQLHDKIKYEYCLKNNIKLFYINYNENINKKLEEILNELYG